MEEIQPFLYAAGILGVLGLLGMIVLRLEPRIEKNILKIFEPRFRAKRHLKKFKSAGPKRQAKMAGDQKAFFTKKELLKMLLFLSKQRTTITAALYLIFERIVQYEYVLTERDVDLICNEHTLMLLEEELQLRGWIYYTQITKTTISSDIE